MENKDCYRLLIRFFVYEVPGTAFLQNAGTDCLALSPAKNAGMDCPALNLAKLIDWGIDGIINDRPDILRGILAARKYNLSQGFTMQQKF